MKNHLLNKSNEFSLIRLAALTFILCVAVFIIIWAKPILVPIVYSILFALTLRPINNALKKVVKINWLAIVITFISVVLPVGAAILLLTSQTVEVLDDLPTITEDIQERLNKNFNTFSDNFNLATDIQGSKWVQEKISEAIDEPFVYVRDLVAGGAGIIGNIFLIFLYTFFILLYQDPIYKFILGQFSPRTRHRIQMVMADSQKMSFTYLKGLGVVMLILGLLNSIGLTLIDIKYAFFWGFLAAFLAIIPYLGTILGGLLPFLYALSTTDTIWQPIAVILLFGAIQAIEGNIITPKVVGSSIQINPLAAIIALFVSGFIWGVEGLILALPFVAFLRIVLVHSETFRPIGLLLSDDLLERQNEFLGRLDNKQYRISTILKTTNQSQINNKNQEQEPKINP